MNKNLSKLSLFIIILFSIKNIYLKGDEINKLQQLGLITEIANAWNKGEDAVEKLKETYNITEQEAFEKLKKITKNLQNQISKLSYKNKSIQKKIKTIKKLNISTKKNITKFGKLTLELIEILQKTPGEKVNLIKKTSPPLLLLIQGDFIVDLLNRD